MSSDLPDELTRVFLEDARAQLAVLADESRPRDARLAAADALKGAAGLVGLGRVRAAAGEVADILAARRAGAREAIARLGGLVDDLAAPGGAAGPEGFDAAEAEFLRRVFRAEASEHLEGLHATLHELERRGLGAGSRPLIDELLRKTHTIKGSAAMVGLDVVTEAAHLVEEAFARLRSGGAGNLEALEAAVDELRGVIAAAEHPAELDARMADLRARLAVPAGPRASGGTPDARRRARGDDQLQVIRVDAARLDQMVDAAGELVFDRTRIERRVHEVRAVARDLNRARAGLRGIMRQLRSLPGTAPPGVHSPNAARIAEIAKQLGGLEEDFAAHLAEINRAAGALSADAESLRRTTTVIHGGLTRVRMTSLRGLFQRLARPLRDAEREAGKRVHVKVSGEDTELDRALVEKITDPLIQLLRNAVAHGIEPAAERVAAGKPAAGEITLSARHQGESLYLEVADDGAGLDPERIRASLVAGGLMSAERARAAPDDRIVAAIFEPGVSTRADADALAGRGVGLDVVRDSVARLGGEISVTSRRGAGTRFSLRLPLTTAVAQAFLFKVNGQTYAIPAVHIVDTMLVDPRSVGSLEGLPVISLHRLLATPPTATDAHEPTPIGDVRRAPVMIIEFAGRRFAATCDKLVGEREIIVKSLGTLLAPLGLFAGATVSGNGKVQLILDAAALAQVAQPPAAAPVPAEPTSDITVDMPAGPRARILVVDDSRTVREAISRLLAGEGHVVDTAADGQEAWDSMHDLRYDLLVTDLEMPRMGGLQLIERVRGEPGLARIPVVVISSRTTAPVRERVAAVGADDFLGKPVSADELIDRISGLLQRRR